MRTAWILFFSLLSGYLIGWAVWGAHLHYQFRYYIRLCSEQDIPFALASDLKAKQRILDQKRLFLAAACLAHHDFRQSPLWLARLRGRWDVNYLALAEAEKRGLEL